MAKNATIILIRDEFIGEYLELTFEIENTGDEALPATLQLRPHQIVLPDGRVKQDVFGNPANPEYDPIAQATWMLGTAIGVGNTDTHILKIPVDSPLFLSTEEHTANCKLIEEGVSQIGATVAVKFRPEDFRNADPFRMGSFGRTLTLSYKLAGLTTSDTELWAGTLDSTNISSAEKVKVSSDSTADINPIIIVGLRQGETLPNAEFLGMNGTTSVESQFTYDELLDVRMAFQPAVGTISVKNNAESTTYAVITAGLTRINGLRILEPDPVMISELNIGTKLTTELVEYRVTIQREVGVTPAFPEIILHKGIAGGAQNVIKFDPPIFAHPGTRIKVYANTLTATTDVYANIVAMRV